MTTHILDRLDEAEKKALRKGTPTVLLMGIDAATALKEELGLDPLEPLNQYHGYKVIVDMSEDFMDTDKIQFLNE
jgi:hypothetical protein